MSERKDISELVALYAVEPDVADLFVEGPRDRAFFEWLLTNVGLTHVSVYEVAAVDVPDEAVERHGNLGGNRGRVVALSGELAQRCTVDLSKRVAGVVDADLDRFENQVPALALLVVTDFPAIESYLFCEPAIDKYLRLALGRTSPSARSLLSHIGPVLQELFLVRVAARRLGIALAPVGFGNSVKWTGNAISFDRRNYATRFIMRDGHASRLAEMIAMLETLHAAPIKDQRLVVHGHDFTDVLAWYTRNVLRSPTPRNQEECALTLRPCVEFGHVSGTALVRELVSRFGSGTEGVSAASPATA